ncbi:hypothetical protein [Streptomyces virginiae]|uniref:hypothetical protein n=1 Tax=Streptomyces virginiae TaxID=1961 RepID=UPI0030E1AB39
MANSEERGAPYVGFTVGISLGMMAGVVLGLLIVDSLALGLGVGVALGLGIGTIRRPGTESAEVQPGES